MLESNGAPHVMRKEARMFVFISVATSVVGGGVSGAALKVTGNASKVSKSYFSKFKHKFESKNKSLVDPDSVDKINEAWRKPSFSTDGTKVKSYNNNKEIVIINKRNLDEKGYLHKDGRKQKYSSDGFVEFDSKFDTVISNESIKKHRKIGVKYNIDGY